MTILKNKQPLTKTLETASNEHGEPHWVTEQRLKALNSMKQRQMPKMAPVNLSDWPLTPNPNQPFKWIRSNCHLIDHLDHFQNDLQIILLGQTTIKIDLPDELDDQGVILTDLFSAFREHPLLMEKFFMKQAMIPEADKLSSYHAAFVNTGIFLYVPENVQLKQPVEMSIFQDNTLDQPMISHILIVAEKNAGISVVQHLQTLGNKANSASCFTEVIAKRGSQVALTSIDQLGKKVTNHLKRCAKIGPNAKISWDVDLINEGDTLLDFNTRLEGHTSQAMINVNAIACHHQKEFLSTKILKQGKETQSHLDQRCLALTHADIRATGIIDNENDPQSTENQPHNQMLTFSVGENGTLFSKQSHGESLVAGNNSKDNTQQSDSTAPIQENGQQLIQAFFKNQRQPNNPVSQQILRKIIETGNQLVDAEFAKTEKTN